MQLKELLKKTGAAQALSIHGNADIDITGIKTDSRQIKKNDLFIAVKAHKQMVMTTYRKP